MILILLILTSLFALIFFGAFWLLNKKSNKKMNKKWQEITCFSVMFVVMLLIIQAALFYCLNRNPMYWDFARFFKDMQILSLFFIAPVFFISYLLFPFTTVKRNKTAFVILSIPTLLTLIIVGYVTVIEILHAFSNM
jgi:hypothetical protein